MKEKSSSMLLSCPVPERGTAQRLECMCPCFLLVKSTNENANTFFPLISAAMMSLTDVSDQ
jgi:TusA-related sulfurtransferase